MGAQKAPDMAAPQIHNLPTESRGGAEWYVVDGPAVKLARRWERSHGLWVRCALPSCQTHMAVGFVHPSRVRSLLANSGFVVGAVKDVGDALFCAKRCAEIYRQSTPGAAAPKLVPAGASHDDISRVTVRPGRRHDGTMVHQVVCDRPACQARIAPLDTKETDAVIRHAKAHGFQQHPHGTFCGGNCAKMHRADLLAGRAEPKPLDAQFIERTRAAIEEHADVAPPPAATPADQARVDAAAAEVKRVAALQSTTPHRAGLRMKKSPGGSA
jgi:hypothetical protein